MVDTGPGLGSGSATVRHLGQQFVELLVFHIHFGALHRFNCRICGCLRAMAPLCRSPNPVILLCRQ